MSSNYFRFLPSDHCDRRPLGVAINLIIIHAISLPPGVFGGEAIAALFLGRLNKDEHPYYQKIAHLRVSAHFFIDRHGLLTQFVPVLARAWHAGASSWCGHKACNDFSIGIELEGDEENPFTDMQYDTLVLLVRLLQQRFPWIGPQQIVGHADVAPGRKWDPGVQFQWFHFKSLLKKNKEVGHWPIVWESLT